MTEAEKQAAALAALDNHQADYGVAPSPRARTFYESGEAWKYEGKCMPPGTEIPMMETGSFRLRVTIPSWLAHTLDFLDDAVVGPDGDWSAAGHFLTLFMCDQGKYIVIRNDDGTVGWFEEETWSSDGDGYRDGVYHLADTLDAFLASLVELDSADWETEQDDEVWSDPR
jgi:hypothetical protein